MGAIQWLVYIISFFVPVFGFVTFWVFSGRQGELDEVGKKSIVASFIGIIVWIILAAIGITMFEIPLMTPVT